MAAFAACALASPAARVEAHGNIDQALQGNAGCNVLNFTASLTQGGGQRQEFVPSQPGLVAVDVCVLAEAGPTAVDVLVRTGTADAPGGVIGGGSIVAGMSSYEHADFAVPIPVTPGQLYVIELATGNGLEITWLGTPHDIDLYAAGASNASALVSDFAFRTYAGTLPATSTPAATKTAMSTKTRTPTNTPAPLVTQPPIPTHTPTLLAPAQDTPTPPSGIAASASTPPSSSQRAAAAPTRTSGVLGGARRVGQIRLPDVGAGARPPAPSLLSLGLVASGVLLLGAGGAFRAAARR
ncbi:MAG: hypothetical protein WEB52_07580 [Dehalococcoidia bacterium]